MFAACCARTFAVATRRSVFLAAVVGCMLAGRADATTIVSVSGTSQTGWTLNPSTNGANNGTFTGAVAGLSGTWWGLYSRSGQTASQTYSFASAMQAASGTNVLPIGGTIQIDVSIGWLDSGAVVGISLQNAAGTNRFETFYRGNGGTDAYILNDLGGEEFVTGPNTSFNSSSWKGTPANFQTIMFTQLAANAYALSFDGSNVTNSGLTVAASDISQVRFFNFNAGSLQNNDQFANNLVVVPEPESLLVVAAGGFAAAARWLTRMGRGRRRATAVC